MAVKPITAKFGLEGDREVVQRAESAAARVDAALRRMDTAAKPAGAGLKALSGFSADLKTQVEGVALSLGPMSGALSAIGPVGAAAALSIGAVGAALGGLLKAYDAAGAFGELAEQVGVSAEFLQEMQFAAAQAGIEAAALETGLTKLNQKLGEAERGEKAAVELFRDLGINVRDANGELRSAQDVIFDVADALAGMDNEGQKVAAAIELFGRSGAKLLPLLSTGAEGVDKLRSEAHRLGIVLSEEVVKAADEVADAFSAMALAAERASLNFLTKSAPNFARGLKVIREAIFGADDPRDELLKLNEEVARLSQRRDELNDRGLKRQAEILTTQISELNARRADLLKQIQDEEDRRVRREAGQELNRRSGSIPKDKSELENAQKEREKINDTIRDLETKLGSTVDKRRAAVEEALNKLPKTATEDDRTRVALLTQQIYDQTEGVKELNKELNDWIDNQFKVYTDQGEVIKQEQEHQRTMREKVQTIRDEIATDEERSAKFRQEIEQLKEYGLTAEEADRALRKLDPSAKRAREAARDLGLTFSSAFEDAIVKGEKLGDVLEGLYQDILRVFIRRGLTEPLAEKSEDLFDSIFGGLFSRGGRSGGGAGNGIVEGEWDWFWDIFGGSSGGGGGGGWFSSIGDMISSWFGGGFAAGAAFNRGKVIPFASGGVIDRPSLFPMALAGERGPEAILPLRRGSDGALGVIAGKGGAGTVVQIIDQRSNKSPEVEVKHSNDPDGRQLIVAVIRDEVQRDLSHRGSISQSMERTFGLRRQGTVR